MSLSKLASRSAPKAKRAPAWVWTPPISTTPVSPGIAITNFDNEMIGLYRPAADGTYTDVAVQAGVGLASQNTLGFGCAFLDTDLDGALDLVVANGHIDEPCATFAAT